MINLDGLDNKLLIFGALFTVSNRLQTLMDSSMTEITAKQWFVLTMLEMCDEAPSLIQLATVCDSSYQNIKKIVLKLQEKGFVLLENDINDKRTKRVRMTSKCAEWELDNRDNAQKFVKAMFSVFTEVEIADFSRYLFMVYDSLGVMSHDKEK